MSIYFQNFNVKFIGMCSKFSIDQFKNTAGKAKNSKNDATDTCWIPSTLFLSKNSLNGITKILITEKQLHRHSTQSIYKKLPLIYLK